MFLLFSAGTIRKHKRARRKILCKLHVLDLLGITLDREFSLLLAYSKKITDMGAKIWSQILAK